MAEPEDVIAEAAYLATAGARALGLRRAAPDARPRLADLRHRLALFVAMLFPDAPPIGAAQAAAPRTLLARWARGGSPHERRDALASTDGARIRLPPELPGLDRDAIVSEYRLLALEQAARAERGSASFVPGDDPLARDLFLLAESAAVDRALVDLVPRLTEEIVAERSAERARRPASGLTLQEHAVERLLGLVLGAEPSAPPGEVGAGAHPRDSLSWARAEVARIRSRGGRYRGIRQVSLWGTVAPAPDNLPAPASGDPRPSDAPTRPEVGRMVRRPRVRASAEDEDDERQGMWLPRADDPKESVEDPMGLKRPADRDATGRPGELGDSLSELPEARLVRTADPVREILSSDEPPPRIPVIAAANAAPHVLVYPEWDYRTGGYRLHGAVVHEAPVPERGPGQPDGVVQRHGARIRRVRREFERLRPRRQTLRRQTGGTDLDVDAWVVSTADRLAGAAPEDRLYLDERRVRRDTAVLLLVDASASTDGWVSGNRRVIDVAREALLIVAEALVALGERHAVYAFRSDGVEKVDLLRAKRFSEPSGEAVRRRIAALEPDGYTRMGAALRHRAALPGVRAAACVAGTVGRATQ
jgi:nitric oxide reductase NorD protein